MRIARLGLTAFGPFSGAELSFGAPGVVEIVFGRNEAGKSTALRALRGLLFGIPENGEDAHRHPASELCLEAELESSDEAPMFVRRRRRRKESLRDRNDAPLDEALLARWLGGIDAAAFERLFAVDHARLAQAAEDMLRGKGDVGETLFDAGSGGSPVGQLLAKLDAEASEIFSPLARTKPLNLRIKAFRETRSELKNAGTAPQAYLAQREDLDRARREIEAHAAERRRLAAERSKLVRIERALPPLGRRRSAALGLAALGSVTPMPAGTPERRALAEETRAAARAESEHLSREIAGRRQRLARALPASPLAGLGEDALLGLLSAQKSVSEGRRELPARKARLLRLDDEILELSERLGFGRDLSRTLAVPVRAADLVSARRLLAERAVANEARAHLERRRLEVLARLDALAREASPPDEGAYEALLTAIDAGGGAAELQARLLSERDHVQRLGVELRLAAARLNPAPRTDLALDELRVPSDESLERLASDGARVEAELARLAERIRDAGAAALKAEREIERIAASGSVPSEEELLLARAERDRTLAALELAAARSEMSELASVGSLRALVLRSDELADRLRREASRVGELAGQRAELALRRRELEELEREAENTQRRRDELVVELRRLFEECGLEPLPAREMRSWLRAQQAAARVAAELRAAAARVDVLEAEAARLSLALSAALGEATDPAADPLALLRAAERRAESERARRRAFDDARRADSRARSELASVEAELAAQDERAGSAASELALRLERLGLDPQLSPADAAELLERLQALADRLEARASRLAELGEHESEEASFRKELEAVLAAFAPELATLPIEAALRTLVERQREAHAAARERQAITQELAELEERLLRAEDRRRAADDALSELAARAGLSGPEELPSWEARAIEAERLRAQLAEAEAELAAVGEGSSIEELAVEAESVERDEIGQQKQELDEELERLEQAIYGARRHAESVEAGLELLGGNRGAESAQRLAEIGAELRDLSSQYARLRIARSLLAQELSRFRDKNQGPILERASGLFERLTLGSFRGLRVGLDANVLECVRAGGQGLAVTELSEGARYQLYFALRLASLERYLDGGVALPFVLDDVFIHWDDERAKAGFQLLAELAERTQVLFFTHHAHLMDLAERALAPGRVRRNQLESLRVSGQAQESFAK